MEMTGFERSTLRWARVAVVMSALAAVFVCLQWIAMRDQLDEMKGSSNQTERLAILNAGQLTQNIRLAEAAKKQADKAETISENIKKTAEQMQRSVAQAELSARQSGMQAQRALDASISAFRIDQRPWALPQAFTLSAEPEVAKQFTVQIAVANSGKTPAMDVIPHSQSGLIYSCSMMPPMPELADPKDVKSIGILPPGQSGITYTTDPFSQITQPEVTSYTNGMTRVVVQGLIRYTDEFHTKHWTKFRVFHEHGTPLNIWSYCDSGNDVDRTENAQHGNKQPN
jgi:hypothetical protein